MTGVLRLACIDSAAEPLFGRSPDGRTRAGYEPDAAELVARLMGRRVEWVLLDWDDMIPAVLRGDADAVWCGQGIIPGRVERLDYTRPYAVFDETVLVRAGDPARAPADLRGRRVAAIAESANLRLASTFPGVRLVPFASTADVFGAMIEALRAGEVDAMVDDDVVTVPLGGDDAFDVAFTVATQNPWGVGVAKSDRGLLDALDEAIGRAVESGELEALWRRWMPHLAFPAALRDGRATLDPADAAGDPARFGRILAGAGPTASAGGGA